MRGRDGSMDIGDFVDLVHQESYRPNIRFLRSRWGRYAGLSSGLCTLVVGNANDGNCYNVPTPRIPEASVLEADGTIVARGWKALFARLIRDRVVRPSPVFEKLLGSYTFDRSKARLGCY